jgi:DNA uptake protein ComE-like DNA-binding protein
VLLCISVLLLMIRVAYPYFIEPGSIVIKNIPLLTDSLQQDVKPVVAAEGFEKKGRRRFFSFDPNTVSHEQLRQLGLNEKTATTFIKFRNKGFRFRKKEDLKNIYGIYDQLFSALAPYVIIKETVGEKPGQAEKNVTPPKSEVHAFVEHGKLDLNSADSAALCGLPGIGPAFSRRIVKYRNALGGFINTEQLKEVFGFTPELYEQVKNKVTAEPSAIRKLDLNKDDFKTINRHPYLSYEITKIIFDWRRKTILTESNTQEVFNDAELYAKMRPYLLLGQ